MKSLINKEKGQLSLQMLIYGAIAIILLSGFLIWADVNVKSVLRYSDQALAFGIAEAGIEYYRWHLAHAPTDYQDGTTSTGPYTHDYYDKNGNLLGQFILDITPPPIGSTIVTIKSTGHVVSDSSIEKNIRVRMGIPSFAKYAALVNENVRFGEGTEVFGEIHSNNGVRFDGIAHNLVTSALNNYDDPDHAGANEYAFHTHRNPPPGSGTNDSFRPLEAPPNPLQNRSDVFLVGRQISVPAVNFTGITQNLSDIKAAASSSGFYWPSSTYYGTPSYGYDVFLKTNDTFDLYRVTALKTPPSSNCTNSQNQDGWGTWSIQSEILMGNY